MLDSILLLLLLLSLNILHVEIKELPYVLRLITMNSPQIHSPNYLTVVFTASDDYHIRFLVFVWQFWLL